MFARRSSSIECFVYKKAAQFVVLLENVKRIEYQNVGWAT